MDWFSNLLFKESVGQTMLIFAFVIATGILLGKIKIKGVALGATFVLFVGILVAHLGFTVDSHILHFIKDFGLILFVFSIGLQVGPNFFSSFKKGGMRLNLLACGEVFLNVIIALIIFYAVGGIDLPMLVGVLSGAVTNTPGLGAAQQTLEQLREAGQITETPPIALGYAVAYPLGVIGVIVGMILLRSIFRINMEKERMEFDSSNNDPAIKPIRLSLQINNDAISGHTVQESAELLNKKFIIARIIKNGELSIPKGDTILDKGDYIRIITTEKQKEKVISLFGKPTKDINWDETMSHFISRRILLTREKFNGKSIQSLHLRKLYGVNITRVNRSGLDLVANDNLELRIGDRITVVGSSEGIKSVENVLGNSMKRLNEPNLITIFIGIFIGIIVGSIPFAFPGMPQPAKLGLAGGPLIVALLMGGFGDKFKLVTYTTQSANLMLREIGICLFLACVGIDSGKEFFNTLTNGDGLLWVWYGLVITMVPMLIIGSIARGYFKFNYFTILGLISGSNTNPPALSYSNMTAGNDAPAVAYSTVYPLSMFLRILTAQMLILFFI